MRAKILVIIAAATATSVASSFAPQAFPTRKMTMNPKLNLIRLHGGASTDDGDIGGEETSLAGSESAYESSVPVAEPPVSGDVSEEPSVVESESESEASVPVSEPPVSEPPVSEPQVKKFVTVPEPVGSAGYMGPNAAPPGLLRKTFTTFPWHRLPNILTYIRCLAIPALMGLFYVPNKHVETSVLFAFASYTDWLDGYLARRWDISSDFGAFLDPVADKLMVSTSLILLAGKYGIEMAIPTCIILARELAVSALREWMAQKGKRDIVKVGFQGKVKTALTMVSITVLLAAGGGSIKLYKAGLAMMYLCTLITVTSGSVYFIAAAPLLLEKET